VKRRSLEPPARRCERINMPKDKRGRGRPKKSLEEMIREDLKAVGLSEDMAQDRRLRWDRIKVLDLKVIAS